MKTPHLSAHAIIASSVIVRIGAFTFRPLNIQPIPISRVHGDARERDSASHLSALSKRPARVSLSLHYRKSTTGLYAKSNGNNDGKKDESDDTGNNDWSPSYEVLDGVDDVAAEAEDALREAEKFIQAMERGDDSVPPSIDGSISTVSDVNALENKDGVEVPFTRPKAGATKKQDAEAQAVQNTAIKSAFGATAFGILAGLIIDLYIAMSDAYISIEPIIPPISIAITLGAIVFNLAKDAVSPLGSTIRSIFGGAVDNISSTVTTAVESAVDSAVEEVKATPDKIKTAVAEKIQETTDEIKQIPVNIKSDIDKAAAKSAEDIKAIPSKVSTAAKEKVEKTKEEIETGLSSVNLSSLAVEGGKLRGAIIIVAAGLVTAGVVSVVVK